MSKISNVYQHLSRPVVYTIDTGKAAYRFLESLISNLVKGIFEKLGWTFQSVNAQAKEGLNRAVDIIWPYQKVEGQNEEDKDIIEGIFDGFKRLCEEEEKEADNEKNQILSLPAPHIEQAARYTLLGLNYAVVPFNLAQFFIEQDQNFMGAVLTQNCVQNSIQRVFSRAIDHQLLNQHNLLFKDELDRNLYQAGLICTAKCIKVLTGDSLNKPLYFTLTILSALPPVQHAIFQNSKVQFISQKAHDYRDKLRAIVKKPISTFIKYKLEKQANRLQDKVIGILKDYGKAQEKEAKELNSTEPEKLTESELAYLDSLVYDEAKELEKLKDKQPEESDTDEVKEQKNELIQEELEQVRKNLEWRKTSYLATIKSQKQRQQNLGQEMLQELKWYRDVINNPLLQAVLSSPASGIKTALDEQRDKALTAMSDTLADQMINQVVGTTKRYVHVYFTNRALLSVYQSHPILAAIGVVAGGGSKQTVRELALRVVGAAALYSTGSGFLSMAIVHGPYIIEYCVRIRGKYIKKAGIQHDPASEMLQRTMEKVYQQFNRAVAYLTGPSQPKTQDDKKDEEQTQPVLVNFNQVEDITTLVKKANKERTQEVEYVMVGTSDLTSSIIEVMSHIQLKAEKLSTENVSEATHVEINEGDVATTTIIEEVSIEDQVPKADDETTYPHTRTMHILEEMRKEFADKQPKVSDRVEVIEEVRLKPTRQPKLKVRATQIAHEIGQQLQTPAPASQSFSPLMMNSAPRIPAFNSNFGSMPPFAKMGSPLPTPMFSNSFKSPFMQQFNKK